MLCLANSYKHGGRCIAGIEVTLDNKGYSIVRDVNGVPKWVRPVSHSAAGEVPNSHALNIRVLSVVKIANFEYAGLYSHSEDVYYQSLSVLGNAKPTHSALNDCLDRFHSTIFGNRGKALTPECFQTGNYSVMLVHAENPEIYIDTRYTPKPRMKFVHNGSNYDFPITDPIYLDKIHAGYVGVLTDVYLVLSLGVFHEGWHSKLVAAIIEPKEDQPIVGTSTQNKVEEPKVNQNARTVPQPKVSSSVTDTNNQNKVEEHKIKQSPTIQTEHKVSVSSIGTNRQNSVESPNMESKATLSASSKIQIPTKSIAIERPEAYYDTLPLYKLKALVVKSDISYTEKLKIRRAIDRLEAPKAKPSVQPAYKKSEGCYIATAVYGSYDASEVLVLREFRDTILKKNSIGRLFIRIYYAISPSVAQRLKNHTMINSVTKKLLNRFVSFLEKRL